MYTCSTHAHIRQLQLKEDTSAKIMLFNTHLPKNMEIEFINLIEFGESFPLHNKNLTHIHVHYTLSHRRCDDR